MNKLGSETSPYLLQHRDNPVHWRPWGMDALAEARLQDKPILLSIGYAACHWCHVMAHESFENTTIAALMNSNFINIKVDREERPDLDKIYMDALHALGEQGGWPLTMFLDGDGNPFWGGTYFPPEPRFGRPGFPHVLHEIARLWRDDRPRITANTAAIKEALTRPSATGRTPLTAADAKTAALAVLPYVDLAHGGLKGAPKFPQVPLFHSLWTAGMHGRQAGLFDAVDITLQHICQGGIYDHLGGGFARYSVDHRWLVPHFEKMLYDNAQLISLLCRVWLKIPRPLFRIRIEETIAFLLAEMRLSTGTFASSFDADSEGEEGRFYVWSYPEVETLLHADTERFAESYGLTPAGNWEGHTILNRLHDIKGEPAPHPAARQILLNARRQRIAPGFDDKTLADWNGLAIQALAEAALVFQRRDWAEAAATAVTATMSLLWNGDTLSQCHRAGRTQHLATADGYANLIAAAITLVPFDVSYLACALDLLTSLNRDFWTGSAYAFSSRSATDLVTRQVFAEDNATPNANGMMAANLAKLAYLTGDHGHASKAEKILTHFAGAARANPFSHGSLFAAAHLFTDTIELRMDPAHPLAPLALAHTGLDVVLAAPPEIPATLLICRNSVCSMPVRTEADLAAAVSLLNLA